MRTTHLVAMTALAGGAWAGVPASALRDAALATALSGAALLVSEASHSRHWVYQGRGLATIAHLAASLLALAWWPEALAASLVIGAVGSHLPKPLRWWSLRHRAVVD